MCKCTPEIRTPWCGKPGCETPKQIKLYKYFCLCGNVVETNNDNLVMKCGQPHGGNVKMLCESQWSK